MISNWNLIYSTVTSKEFETCAEDTEIPEDKDTAVEKEAAVKPEVVKPISPPIKKKQPSIKNFFTRK